MEMLQIFDQNHALTPFAKSQIFYFLACCFYSLEIPKFSTFLSCCFYTVRVKGAMSLRNVKYGKWYKEIN